MKKNLFYILIIISCITACDDYNDQFKGLEESSKVTNVASYEMEYTGTYPSAGYFEGKEEVETEVGKWLLENFSTCDSASTANISVLTGDIVEGYEGEYITDMSYILATADYDAMGTDRGYPGKYDEFNKYMDVDFYLSIFLRDKYPYAKNGTTCNVSYAYYNAETSETSIQSRIYKCNSSVWSYYAPYADVVTVSGKIAQLFYNGHEWKLERLIGGTMSIDFADEKVNAYELLYNWVKTNKPDYLSTQNNYDEYYFGSSVKFSNLNNKYTTWKEHGIDGEYDNKTNDEMQAIMDARLAEGIIEVILPVVITEPDPGLSYIVIYEVYGGRGDGSYSMSFMYNEETQLFELISGVSRL